MLSLCSFEKNGIPAGPIDSIFLFPLNPLTALLALWHEHHVRAIIAPAFAFYLLSVI